LKALSRRSLKNIARFLLVSLIYVALFTVSTLFLDYVRGSIASSIIAGVIAAFIYVRSEPEVSIYTCLGVSLTVGFLASIPSVILYYLLRGLVVEMASKMKAYEFLLFVYTTGLLVFTYIVVSIITAMVMSVSLSVSVLILNAVRENLRARKYMELPAQ